jgi:hypothetical protein
MGKRGHGEEEIMRVLQQAGHVSFGMRQMTYDWEQHSPRASLYII